MADKVVEHRLTWIRCLFVAALVVGGSVGLAHAQSASNGAPRTQSGFEPHVPLTGPERGPTSIAPFLDSLEKTDAMFEVVVGQGRLITTKQDIAGDQEGVRSIAVGDPTVLDFEIVGRRHLRVTGLRMGQTDLSITTEREVDGRTELDSHEFEVLVVADLDVLRARLRAIFPGAALQIRQVRDHLIVEGQARDAREVNNIMLMIEAYLESLQVENSRTMQLGMGAGGTSMGGGGQGPPLLEMPVEPGQEEEPPPMTEGEAVGRIGGMRTFRFPEPQIINLIRVPGPQQVMLQVKIAELNRTALREVGADLVAEIRGRNILATELTGSTFLFGPQGVESLTASPSTTAFALFPSANVFALLKLLRENSILKIHAEPNLVTMSGQQASFLAGGEFPVPVPQQAGAVGQATFTIEFKRFGVQLDFIPYILDGDVIRLTVTPEVSSLDDAIGVNLLGFQVPGLNSRRASTTLEMRQGQTLAMAGLLQVEMNAQTSRIPGLGDLPYIGPLFSNTTHQQVEKELLVLVTPHLVEAMEPHEVPPLPGDEVYGPNDCEFFLLNRIEGRTGVPFRATSEPKARGAEQLKAEQIQLEGRRVRGPHGFSE